MKKCSGVWSVAIKYNYDVPRPSFIAKLLGFNRVKEMLLIFNKKANVLHMHVKKRNFSTLGNIHGFCIFAAVKTPAMPTLFSKFQRHFLDHHSICVQDAIFWF